MVIGIIANHGHDSKLIAQPWSQYTFMISICIELCVIMQQLCNNNS